MREWKDAYGLSAKQAKFVKEFLTNGQDAKAACIAAGYSANGATVMATKLQKKPEIQRRIAAVQTRNLTQTKISFEYKLDKLNKVIDQFIPDDEAIDPKRATVGISAIAETNRMQGHYAPDKHANLNYNIKGDSDVIGVKELIDEIKVRERDY